MVAPRGAGTQREDLVMGVWRGIERIEFRDVTSADPDPGTGAGSQPDVVGVVDIEVDEKSRRSQE